MKHIILLTLCLLFTHSLFAKDKLDHLLDQVDNLYRSKTSKSKVEMTIINPNWKRTMTMEIWTKGLDYTFLVIKSPRKDKGVSSLKRENEMWNFFPKINKVVKIPASMMMSSWMGSDFTNDDLVKENTLTEDYKGKMLTSDHTDQYLIELTPRKNTVSVWGKIHLYMDKKQELPTEQLFFDELGKKVRVMKFRDIQKVEGKIIPMVMELTPLHKEGHKTIVKYLKIKFNLPIADKTFTRKNLKKRR